LNYKKINYPYNLFPMIYIEVAAFSFNIELIRRISAAYYAL
jgi:hypothetical protein